MGNKLSHSAASMLSTCGKKYKYHYIDRLRDKNSSGALLFGSAIDIALNDLLEYKSLNKAKSIFNNSWRYGRIGSEKETSDLTKSERLVYSKSDFDVELLNKEDLLVLDKQDNALKKIEHVFNLKEKHGIENLTSEQRQFYNHANWLVLRHKGEWMLEAYAKEILPKIKKVLTIQKPIELDNGKGDKIVGFIDLAVTWEDGKNYILDNKTSSIDYEEDSGSTSQQLILYYHAQKEEYNLSGVGFIVMKKHVLKNKVKICSKCENDGSGRTHKTCERELNKVRCNGEWKISLNPKIKIDIILNSVDPQAEELVMENFDTLNEKLNSGIFEANLQACKNPFPCQYYNLCWKGKKDNLIKVE